MEQFDDALRYFKQSLDIYQSAALDEQKDYGVAELLRQVESYLLNMHLYVDALKYLRKSHGVYEQLSPSDVVGGKLWRIRLKIKKCNKHVIAINSIASFDCSY